MASNKVLSFVVKAVDKVSFVMKGIASGVASVVKSVVSNLANIKAGFDMLSGLVDKVGKVMREAFAFDDLHQQWTNLIGDSDKAREHCEMLWELGETPPFDAKTFSEASQALQNWGGAALNTKENLIKFGDAAVATGNSVTQVSDVMGRAFAIIRDGSDMGRAVMMLQNMKLITPEVADGLKKMASEGASARDMWNAIKGSLDKYNGAMDAAGASANGMVETIKGKWSTTLKKFGDTFIDLAKDKLGGLISRITELNNSGKIEQWAKKALDAISPLVNGIENLFDGEAREITIKAAKDEFIALFELLGDLMYAGLKSAGEYITSYEMWSAAARSFWDALKRLSGNIVGGAASGIGTVAKWLGVDAGKVDDWVDSAHAYADDTYGTDFSGTGRRRGGFRDNAKDAWEAYKKRIADANAEIEKANKAMKERKEAEKKAEEETKAEAVEESISPEEIALMEADETRRAREEEMAKLTAEFAALERAVKSADENAAEFADRLADATEAAEESADALDTLRHGLGADGTALTARGLSADADARKAQEKAAKKNAEDAEKAQKKLDDLLARREMLDKSGRGWETNMGLSKWERELMKQYDEKKARADAAAEAKAMAEQDAGTAAAQAQQLKDALAAKGVEIGDAKEQIDALNEQTGWLKKIATNTSDMGAA